MTEEARLAGARVPANARVSSLSMSSNSSNATIGLLYHRSELLPRAVKTRLHRPQRQTQESRDFFIGSIFHVKQH
jgi:hypothetical protein